VKLISARLIKRLIYEEQAIHHNADNEENRKAVVILTSQ